MDESLLIRTKAEYSGIARIAKVAKIARIGDSGEVLARIVDGK
jgi:hypothetical protein